MANFDPKRVTPIEWAGIGAGALAFIASFFPWYTVSYTGGFGLSGIGGSLSAWGVGILGWGAVLMLLAAGVLLVLPHVGTAVKNLSLIWLILAVVSVLFVIIRWLTLSSSSGLGSLGADVGISEGAGFGLYLGLLAAIGSTVGAVLVFLNQRKTVPPQAPPAPPAYPAA
ncbi:hypothetical protein [Actinokineospora inagensis]|uniref:hypothetical protein n=1 Tax=Actinokineospora inagensis TaxID=103730 RepID=UPI000410970D|nr:hypothetical protein [Actinokineospora inagensis]